MHPNLLAPGVGYLREVQPQSESPSGSVAGFIAGFHDSRQQFSGLFRESRFIRFVTTTGLLALPWKVKVAKIQA
jgi:hypothetical protein